MAAPTSPASPMSLSSALSYDDEQVVAAFDSLMEAELARGRLEAEGIAARIADGNMAGIGLALGGVKLVVAESDVGAARALLFAPSAIVEDEPRPDPDQPRQRGDGTRQLRLALVVGGALLAAMAAASMILR